MDLRSPQQGGECHPSQAKTPMRTPGFSPARQLLETWHSPPVTIPSSKEARNAPLSRPLPNVSQARPRPRRRPAVGIAPARARGCPAPRRRRAARGHPGRRIAGPGDARGQHRSSDGAKEPRREHRAGRERACDVPGATGFGGRGRPRRSHRPGAVCGSQRTLGRGARGLDPGPWSRPVERGGPPHPRSCSRRRLVDGARRGVPRAGTRPIRRALRHARRADSTPARAGAAGER
jgi:hypothetical protein